MRRRLSSLFVLFSVACIPVAVQAVSWTEKAVARLSAMYAFSNCVYFTLDGVTQADPAVPNQPWFAFLRTQNGAQDAYAALLAAKLSGAQLQVNTNGTTSCGYATATEVIFH